MNEIIFDENNMSVVPEGYKWCDDCIALTPHKPGQFAWTSDCVICGDSLHDNSDSCPNCGYTQEEEHCECREVIVHHNGCHENQIEYDDNDGSYFFGSFDTISEQVIKEFTESYMAPAPNRSSFILPRDKEWYDLNQKLKKDLRTYIEMFKCGCPRYNIYGNIHNIITGGGSEYSMDCSNAAWWSWKKRCPICGCVFEGDDSNC